MRSGCQAQGRAATRWQGLWMGVLVLLVWAGVVSTARADKAVRAAEPVRIGVFAYRSVAQTRAQWAPTVAHLQKQLPGYRFELLPLEVTALSQAIAARKLAFVLTQPEHYVRMRFEHGLAAIATLMPLAGGVPVSQFGGVIFTRADREDVRELADVRAKVVAAPHEQGLGGYRMQQWTLHKAGVRLPGDVAAVRFVGHPQDKVVADVLAGRADVGFVRTGLLESLAADGKLDPGQVRVLNRQPATLFPQALSTELYPEWPVVALRGVPDALVKDVTLALLGIDPASEAARQGGYHGFSPPGDYAPLETMLQRLRVDPGRLDSFDVRDIARKYALQIAAGLGGLLALAMVALVRLQRDRRRLAAAARERTLLLSSLGEGVYGVGAGGVCTFINPAALEMLGLREEEVVGKDPHRLFHHHRPDGSDYPRSECPMFLALATGVAQRGEDWFFRRDGERFPVAFSAKPMLHQGRVIGAVVAFQDISERKRIEEEQRLAAVAFETQEGIVITDALNRILRVNRAFTQVTGYLPEEVTGNTPAILKSGRHDLAFYQAMWAELQRCGRWQGEIWNRRKNGEVYPEWLTVTAVRDGQGAICHYVAAFLDISEHKAAQARLEYLTLYDSLTGLPNRQLFRERLHHALGNSARGALFGGLLFLDLDNFRHLNDTLGHGQGDAVLVETARRLQEVLGSESTLARLGGDDFVLLLESLGRELGEAAASAEQQAEALLAALAQPYALESGAYHGNASVGITVFLGHRASEEELIKQAELAMYQAKEGGRGTIRFFDPSVQNAVASRLSLERDLRQALQNGGFSLAYQPQVGPDGAILGAEALLRWRHPHRGKISPAVFIPLAERCGQILAIGAWVLAAACRQLAVWQSRPETAGWTLAVNISARQFHQPDFVCAVREVLAQTGAHPRGLKLELTESQLVEDLEGTIEKMAALRALGLSLSLDDFGTGYSSLSYLKRLPLGQLKIDQSFVRDLGEESGDEAIVQAIIGMAGSLGLEVIAEGVETAAQRDLLVRWGCQRFQGFYFHRPMSADALAALATQT